MNITENEKFNTGFQLHCEGELKEAELIYNEILAVNPKNTQVLNLLGIIKLNSNKQLKPSQCGITHRTE